MNCDCASTGLSGVVEGAVVKGCACRCQTQLDEATQSTAKQTIVHLFRIAGRFEISSHAFRYSSGRRAVKWCSGPLSVGCANAH